MKCKWLIKYDDSVIVRRLFAGKTDDGKEIILKPYRTVYTMAGKTAKDALAGEELFISNMRIDLDNEDDEELDF